MPIEYREQHRREAIIGTVAVHALLLALFVFTVFKGPDPPLLGLGGDGVELNYGVDEAGSGDVQSKAVANESPNREDSRPPASSPDPEPRPVQQAAPPVPQEAAEEKIVTSEAEESPVKLPPVEKPAPRKEEVKEVPKASAEKPRTLYTPKGSANGGGNGENGTSNAPTGNNNGDKPGSVGDQGNPNGSLDAKALYGQPGSGGSGRSPGSGGLEMSGWGWVKQPSAPPIDNNPGFVRFKIKINADGEVESISKVSGNVSPAQEKAFRDALENAEFRRTSSAEGGATGFVTFRVAVQ
ncbi:hypothetical protein [Hymenobacter cellulosivorans]|uniref:TonB family protein n=1 Tax=Hymenobacter cellulosivorans TaxID=2932249 RepID=A0ABY4F6T5_9BACT|nr:hypothetical protein [Hymenobacter cellulosivorans]UOQ51629.1 hypothetical protein MUN80_17920 [Hymenobacter cellulosivorans]